MIRFLIAMVVLLAASPAWAQPVPMECQLLPVHVPKGDVAFKPGVDVRGKPVVPADINAAPIEPPKTIVIPLTVDMAKKLTNNNVDGLKLDAPLGMLEIHSNGRVVYNDRDLTPQVYALCGREGVPGPVTPPQTDAPGAAPAEEAPSRDAKAANGQAAADAIKSHAVEITPTQAIPPDSEVIEGGESREEGYK